MREWTVGEVLDAVAAVVPDRAMTVCGARRTTFEESNCRTTHLANYLASRGLGAGVAARPLRRWECGQDRVALVMHNDLYLDVYLGCLRGRVVPVNVNHHYTAHEIAALLERIRPRAVVHHRSLTHLIADSLPACVDTVITIDDGPGPEDAGIPGAVSFEDALAVGAGSPDAGAGSPDDLLMVCTGGTTGPPKGVLWRQGDAYLSLMTGMDHATTDDLVGFVPSDGEPYYGLSPLMHAAGLSTALSAVMAGRTAVVHDNRGPFDPAAVLDIAAREQVRILTIVGDAHAGPLVERLRSGSYDLPHLIGIGSGGAAINARHKEAILELLPHIVILDTFGASETGGMATGPSLSDAVTDTMVMHPTGRVVSADRSRFLTAGDDEVGWIARTGRVPLGYFEDEEATARTFPEVDGIRVAIPGDRARITGDGAVRLLGRDSLVVNSGGEKIFVEEVEDALRGHPLVVDALAVGRPSERWGTELVAVVALEPGAALTAEDLRAHVGDRLARFKIPKDIVVVDAIARLANGKADYRWARQAAGTPRPAPAH